MAAGVTSRQDDAAAWIAALHDEVTAAVVRIDGDVPVREDRWERDGGGGGVTRVLADGSLFEKGGVNRSVVHGVLPPEALARMKDGADSEVDARRFFAAGVSLVLHPHSPHVPTTHLNVRYFELLDDSGTVHDAWFGGGIDLTPYQAHTEDPVTFHRAVQRACDRWDPTYYARFKPWCDRYFVNQHRGGEARGVGGIFFDHLRPGELTGGWEAGRGFAHEIAMLLPEAYAPIVARRRDLSWSERERRFQLLRRGRYVEFNLVHDRGTLFGLQTGGRIESILMSLPPLVAWEYDPPIEPGSPEAALVAMLTPRDWVQESERPASP